MVDALLLEKRVPHERLEASRRDRWGTDVLDLVLADPRLAARP
jgi:hypothetical protein